MPSEQDGEFDDFLDDLLDSQGDYDAPPPIGYCTQIMGYRDDGEPIVCNNDCSPSSQICRACTNYGIRTIFG